MQYNLKQVNYNNTIYNKFVSEYYDNTFKYIRFFYDTNRTDSEFWKYLTNNKPKWLTELNEKISIDFLDQKSIPGYMFTATNFLSIAYNHGKFTDTSSINRYLNNKHLYDVAKTDTDKINQIKSSKIQHAISHEQWIKNIINSINT